MQRSAQHSVCQVDLGAPCDGLWGVAAVHEDAVEDSKGLCGEGWIMDGGEGDGNGIFLWYWCGCLVAMWTCIMVDFIKECAYLVVA